MGPPYPLLLLALVSSLLAGAASQLSGDVSALLAFSDAFPAARLSWNATDAGAPCSWHGVRCVSGRVTELRLPGAGLIGPIPNGSLGNLTTLQSLSLRLNRLTSPLPEDLSALPELRHLFLNENSLSGEVPAVVFDLSGLVNLSLSGNDFSGGISPNFNRMSQLSALMLDRNNFSGEIPDLGNLTRLTLFNVSFNRLNGSIPAKLSVFPASSFIGNSLCGGNLSPCPGEPPAEAPSPTNSPNAGGGGDNGNAENNGKKHKLSAGAIAGIAIGCSVGVLLVIVLIVFCIRSRKRAELSIEAPERAPVEAGAVAQENKRIQPQPPVAVARGVGEDSRKLVFLGRAQRIYDLEDLLRASAEVLGRGTCGTTYKAMLEMGVEVAVKRLKDVNIPERQFREKIESIGALDHPNLVTLQAYYYSKDEKLLVMDFVVNGSLSTLIHGNKESSRAALDWASRLNIILGTARGIEYIHSRGNSFSHGGIKSTNILLGPSNEVLVSDTGLCSIGSNATPNRLAGYQAPEVTDARKISQKADVYSFGVLLLELLTGKAPAQAINNDESFDLPRWVHSVANEEWTSKVFDPELLKHQNSEEQLVQVLKLAIDCVAQHPDQRPSMSEVVECIKEIQKHISEYHHQQE